jgi:hypothetical protein
MDTGVYCQRNIQVIIGIRYGYWIILSGEYTSDKRHLPWILDYIARGINKG